jgi:hypothetical protein
VTNITFCFLAFEIKICLCLGELGKQHSIHFLFVWGSYWKHQVTSPVTTETSKERSSCIDWINPWQACHLRAFCSLVKHCGTNLLQIFQDLSLRFCELFLC